MHQVPVQGVVSIPVQVPVQDLSVPVQVPVQDLNVPVLGPVQDHSVPVHGPVQDLRDTNTIIEGGDDDDESVNGLPVVIRQISGKRIDSPMLGLSGPITLGEGEDPQGRTISSISLQKDNTLELSDVGTPPNSIDTAAPPSILAGGVDRFVRLEFSMKKLQAHVGLGITIVASEVPIPGLHQIRRILPGGVAGRDGRLRAGDRLAAVNGVPLQGLKSPEVQQTLAEAPKDFHLIVYRDLDFEFFDASSSITSFGSVSRSSIISSEDESQSPTKRFSDSYDQSSTHTTGAAVSLRGMSNKSGVPFQHQKKRWSTGVLHEPSTRVSHETSTGVSHVLSPLLHVTTSSNAHNLSPKSEADKGNNVYHVSEARGLQATRDIEGPLLLTADTPEAGRGKGGDHTPEAGRGKGGDHTPEAGRGKGGDRIPEAGRGRRGDHTSEAGREGDHNSEAGRGGDHTSEAGRGGDHTSEEGGGRGGDHTAQTMGTSILQGAECKTTPPYLTFVSNASHGTRIVKGEGGEGGRGRGREGKGREGKRERGKGRERKRERGEREGGEEGERKRERGEREGGEEGERGKGGKGEGEGREREDGEVSLEDGGIIYKCEWILIIVKEVNEG